MQNTGFKRVYADPSMVLLEPGKQQRDASAHETRYGVGREDTIQNEKRRIAIKQRRGSGASACG